MPKLFSYGTLQQPKVQRETFGHLLGGSADSLPGFELGEVRITDAAVVATSGKAVHPIIRPSAEPDVSVVGMVFDLSPAELAHADTYEVDAYRRVRVTLASGTEAWAYVDAAVKVPLAQRS